MTHSRLFLCSFGFVLRRASALAVEQVDAWVEGSGVRDNGVPHPPPSPLFDVGMGTEAEEELKMRTEGAAAAGETNKSHAYSTERCRRHGTRYITQRVPIFFFSNHGPARARRTCRASGISRGGLSFPVVVHCTLPLLVSPH